MIIIDGKNYTYCMSYLNALQLQVNRGLEQNPSLLFFSNPVFRSEVIVLSTYNPFALTLSTTSSLTPSSSTTTLMSNQVVFFDVAIGGRPAGRVEMTLFSDVCPRTCENFRVLCKWTI